MREGVTYYQWKERGEGGELYTPWADPYQYEYPMDLLFDSPENALEVALDFGATKEEIEEWELVTTSIKVVPHPSHPA